MGRKRHTPEQIITALREAEVGLARGKSVKLISRELGGMKVSQARRLKELERENGRLKRAVADLTLDKLILEEAARETSEPRAPTTLCGACTSAARGVGEESVPGARAATHDPGMGRLSGPVCSIVQLSP